MAQSGGRRYWLSVLTVLTGVLLMGATDDPLKPFQWKARVVVVSAPSADDAQLQAQLAILADDEAGRQDRELQVVRLVGDGAGQSLDPAALRERLSLPPDRFELALVGKDGTVVLRRHEPITLADLFARIDAMPMRRAELRRRAEGGEP